MFSDTADAFGFAYTVVRSLGANIYCNKYDIGSQTLLFGHAEAKLLVGLIKEQLTKLLLDIEAHLHMDRMLVLARGRYLTFSGTLSVHDLGAGYTACSIHKTANWYSSCSYKIWHIKYWRFYSYCTADE